MTHFDTVEDYDSVIPKHITSYFLHKKVAIILEALQRSFDIGASLHGLDLGCGTGDIVNLLSEKLPHSHITGLDNSKQMLSHATRKYQKREFILGDIMDLPFPDNNFDFVVATNSLHHLSNREEQLKVLSEVNRVLKQNTVFIINEMNTRNPTIWFYLKHIFPRFREFELGNEVHLNERLIKDTSFFYISNITYYTFVPDICPAFLFGLAKRIDTVLDRSPLSSMGCHLTIVATKRSS